MLYIYRCFNGWDLWWDYEIAFNLVQNKGLSKRVSSINMQMDWHSCHLFYHVAMLLFLVHHITLVTSGSRDHLSSLDMEIKSFVSTDLRVNKNPLLPQFILVLGRKMRSCLVVPLSWENYQNLIQAKCTYKKQKLLARCWS